MQAKQILMFDGREEFYNWLVDSDLAISIDEIESNDKKKSVLIAPLQSVKTYVDYVNYFQCDSIQTMAWSTKIEGSDKPNLNIIPIHIGSEHLTLSDDIEVESKNN